jgi:MerR family transcriptional regulator, mercuric resistance operon regulatory protein
MAAVTTSRAEGCSIGELSRTTRVNIETIRYYERIGILPRARRTSGRRRVYGPEEARSLAFVRRARELGFTLDEVRALLALGGPGRGSCRQVEKIASHHLAQIRTKIADLTKLESVLASTIARCADGSRPRCPVLDILDRRPYLEPSQANPQNSR